MPSLTECSVTSCVSDGMPVVAHLCTGLSAKGVSRRLSVLHNQSIYSSRTHQNALKCPGQLSHLFLTQKHILLQKGLDQTWKVQSAVDECSGSPQFSACSCSSDCSEICRTKSIPAGSIIRVSTIFGRQHLLTANKFINPLFPTWLVPLLEVSPFWSNRKVWLSHFTNPLTGDLLLLPMVLLVLTSLTWPRLVVMITRSTRFEDYHPDDRIDFCLLWADKSAIIQLAQSCRCNYLDILNDYV